MWVREAASIIQHFLNVIGELAELPGCVTHTLYAAVIGRMMLRGLISACGCLQVFVVGAVDGRVIGWR